MHLLDSSLSATHLSDSYIFELGGKGEDPEQFYLTQRWFQQLVVCSDGLMGQIVVAGYTTKFCHLTKIWFYIKLHSPYSLYDICSNI